MLKPIIPLVEDGLAHFFWEAEHIATVHAHEGVNHVHKELGDSQKSTDNNGSPMLKNAEPVSSHLIVESHYDFFFSGHIVTNACIYIQTLQDPYKNISYPPPKFLS